MLKLYHSQTYWLILPVPDFVLTIVILTLSWLLLLNSGFRLSYEAIVSCVLRLLERIGEYNSETLNVIVDTKLSKFRFDCFHGPFWSLPSSFVVPHCRFVSIVSIYIRANVFIDDYSLTTYCCWSYLLMCIVVYHDVNIAAKQCFSCTNALCYISTASLYQKLHQLERVNSSGAAWRSRLLRMEWSGLLVWWAAERNDCGGNTATGVRLLQRCAWLQKPDHLRYITM